MAQRLHSRPPTRQCLLRTEHLQPGLNGRGGQRLRSIDAYENKVQQQNIDIELTFVLACNGEERAAFDLLPEIKARVVPEPN